LWNDEEEDNEDQEIGADEGAEDNNGQD